MACAEECDRLSGCLCLLQAFINTARKIYEKIEQGVFDVSNEVGSAGGVFPATSTLLVVEAGECQQTDPVLPGCS